MNFSDIKCLSPNKIDFTFYSSTVCQTNSANRTSIADELDAFLAEAQDILDQMKMLVDGGQDQVDNMKSVAAQLRTTTCCGRDSEE